METQGRRRSSPLTRIAFALPVLLAIARVPAASQTQCVELTRTGEAALATAPGRILTVAVLAENRTAGARRLDSRLMLPAGWRSLTPDEPFTLAGGQADTRLLSFTVPASAPAGVYRLSFVVTDNAMPPCRSELAFDVRVDALRRIDLQLEDPPRYLIAGAACRVAFILRNLGNERSVIRLSAWDGKALSAVPESAAVSLLPMESRRMALTISAVEETPESFREVVTLRAVLARDTTVAVSASCLLEIIPRVSAGETRFHEIPLVVKLRGAGESGQAGQSAQAGGQLEVAGGGTLTDRGTDRVDLLVRTPDIQTRSILGLHDEYRAGYLSESAQIGIGDRAYELSPLTELARYAFGAYGKVTSGELSAGGFVNQTRFYSPLQREQAGFVGYGVSPGVSLSANFLRKEDYHTSNIATARGIVRPADGTSLELEYGMSTLDGAGDNACAARLLGNQDWVSYDARFVHAGPSYGGYYRDVNFTSASLNARPWENLRLEAFAQEERQNLLDDTLQLVAPRDRYMQFGAGWGELIAVYYRQVEERDVLPVPKFDRIERTMQVRSGWSFPDGNVYASVDIGGSREYLLQNSGPLRRVQLSASVRPESHQSYGCTLEYEQQPNLYAGEQMETWSGSLSAAIEIAARTHVLCSLYGTRVAAPFVQSYALADLSVSYELPCKHTITVRGRQSMFAPAADGKDQAFLVEYAIPLSIPVTRLTGSGALRGRVYDDSTHAALGNVVLYAGGATAVTDDAGEYIFPSLKPDVYAVQVDLGSAGVGRVTVQPAPFLVTVLGGEEARLDIGVVPSASVGGEITVYDFREGTAADTTGENVVQAGKATGVLLELAGKEGVFRRFTDNRGRFRFADLRPGDWVLRVSSDGLPEYHYNERDSVRFTLHPRDHSDAALRVLPKKRKIRILEQGTLREGAAPQIQKTAPAPAQKSPQRQVPAQKPPRRTAKPQAGGKSHSTLSPSLRLSRRVIMLACWRAEVRACRDVSSPNVD